MQFEEPKVVRRSWQVDLRQADTSRGRNLQLQQHNGCQFHRNSVSVVYSNIRTYLPTRLVQKRNYSLEARVCQLWFGTTEEGSLHRGEPSPNRFRPHARRIQFLVNRPPPCKGRPHGTPARSPATRQTATICRVSAFSYSTNDSKVTDCPDGQRHGFIDCGKRSTIIQSPCFVW